MKQSKTKKQKDEKTNKEARQKSDKQLINESHMPTSTSVCK